MNPVYRARDPPTVLDILLKWTCQHELPCLITQREPTEHVTVFQQEMLIFLCINFLLQKGYMVFYLEVVKTLGNNSSLCYIKGKHSGKVVSTSA